MDLTAKCIFYDDIANLPDKKENYFIKAMAIICQGWTWARMTDREQETLYRLLEKTTTAGSLWQRMETLFWVQHAYLVGIGYNPSGPWRETA